MPSIASVFHVSFPKNRTQILRSSSDGGHRPHASVVLVLEVILGLSEINDLYFSGLSVEEHISWLQISVAHSIGEDEKRKEGYPTLWR